MQGHGRTLLVHNYANIFNHIDPHHPSSTGAGPSVDSPSPFYNQFFQARNIPSEALTIDLKTDLVLGISGWISVDRRSAGQSDLSQGQPYFDLIIGVDFKLK
jgi:hypothetical protein